MGTSKWLTDYTNLPKPTHTMFLNEKRKHYPFIQNVSIEKQNVTTVTESKIVCSLRTEE